MRKGSKVEVDNIAIPIDYRDRGERTKAVVDMVRDGVVRLKLSRRGDRGWWVNKRYCHPIVRYTRFERKVRAYIERELGNV